MHIEHAVHIDNVSEYFRVNREIESLHINTTK